MKRKMTKKMLLTLLTGVGLISSVALPLTMTSCGSNDSGKNNNPQPSNPDNKDQYENISKVTISGITEIREGETLYINASLETSSKLPQNITYKWWIYKDNQWSILKGQNSSELRIQNVGIEYNATKIKLEVIYSTFEEVSIESNEIGIIIDNNQLTDKTIYVTNEHIERIIYEIKSSINEFNNKSDIQNFIKSNITSILSNVFGEDLSQYLVFSHSLFEENNGKYNLGIQIITRNIDFIRADDIYNTMLVDNLFFISVHLDNITPKEIIIDSDTYNSYFSLINELSYKSKNIDELKQNIFLNREKIVKIINSKYFIIEDINPESIWVSSQGSTLSIDINPTWNFIKSFDINYDDYSSSSSSFLHVEIENCYLPYGENKNNEPTYVDPNDLKKIILLLNEKLQECNSIKEFNNYIQNSFDIKNIFYSKYDGLSLIFSNAISVGNDNINKSIIVQGSFIFNKKITTDENFLEEYYDSILIEKNFPFNVTPVIFKFEKKIDNNIKNKLVVNQEIIDQITELLNVENATTMYNNEEEYYNFVKTKEDEIKKIIFSNEINKDFIFDSNFHLSINRSSVSFHNMGPNEEFMYCENDFESKYFSKSYYIFELSFYELFNGKNVDNVENITIELDQDDLDYLNAELSKLKLSMTINKLKNNINIIENTLEEYFSNKYSGIEYIRIWDDCISFIGQNKNVTLVIDDSLNKYDLLLNNNYLKIDRYLPTQESEYENEIIKIDSLIERKSSIEEYNEYFNNNNEFFTNKLNAIFNTSFNLSEIDIKVSSSTFGKEKVTFTISSIDFPIINSYYSNSYRYYGEELIYSDDGNIAANIIFNENKNIIEINLFTDLL